MLWAVRIVNVDVSVLLEKTFRTNEGRDCKRRLSIDSQFCAGLCGVLKNNPMIFQRTVILFTYAQGVIGQMVL